MTEKKGEPKPKPLKGEFLTPAGFKSEWWPDLSRNGGRLQIGTPAGFMSEYPAGLNRNPHVE
jgi:hypothetical protein